MRTPSLSTAILSSLVLGLLLGTGLNIVNPGLADAISVWIKPIGSLWINSIRMTVIPLLMSLLLTAISSNGGGSSTAKLGLKTLGLFILFIAASSFYTFAFAPPLIGLLNIDPQASAALLATTSAATVSPDSLPPFSDWLIGLIPPNPIAAASNGDILPLLIFTALLASALLQTEASQRNSLTSFFAGIREAMLVLIGWIMKLAPIGIFSIVYPLAATLGLDAITALGSFILMASGLISATIIALIALVTALPQYP